MASTAWPEEVRAVYVLCHPQKEKARWERLLPHLLSRGIPQDRIRVCAPTWGSDLTPEQIFAVYDPFLKRGNLPTFSFKAAGLTRGEISLGLNFVAAVKDIVSRGLGVSPDAGSPDAGSPDAGSPDDLYITLESDVWLREDFVPRLTDLISSAEDLTRSWDYISLGEGVGTRPPNVPPSYYAPCRAYKPPHQWVFRCTDSMLFRKSFLDRFSQSMIPFKEIIDWEMNFQLSFLHKGAPLWADPPLAEQGTCYNRLATSLPA